MSQLIQTSIGAIMNWRIIGEMFKIRGPRSIYIYSVLIGILSGLLAFIFSVTLSTAEYYSFQILAGIEYQHPPGETKPLNEQETQTLSPIFHSSSLILFFLPIIGGFLVGLILQFLYKEASGAGTDSMIRAFHYEDGKVPGRGVIFKAISTILTLATGGSGGREGPTAYIGAALGSRIGRIMGAGARARRTLLLAGTAGGLGAIFRAPLGGAMTAVEILYREDIESDSLVPCLISSVTAYLTFTGIVGPGSLFEVNNIGLQEYRELFIYAFLGIVCYGVGIVYVRLLRLIENITHLIKVPLCFKPAIGGFFIGCLALFLPEVTGSGMGYLHETINERSSLFFDNGQLNSLPKLSAIFLLLAFFKILATTITIGSRGSGGLFAPSLFIGAMLGGSVATFSQWLLPDWEISLSSFMLVGMGAFFAGVARTPFSAMIMISDIIGSYALLPPLMMVSMITFILSSRWSLYKGQVHNRFKSPAHFWDMRIDLLEKMTIDKEFSTFQKDSLAFSHLDLAHLETKFSKSHDSDFVIITKEGKYHGMLSLKKKSRIRKRPLSNMTVGDLCEIKLPTVQIKNTMADSLEKITKSEMNKVAVVDKNNFVLGYIRRNDIFAIYRKKSNTQQIN